MAEPLSHRWRVRSRHRTSEGVVRYEACHCGVARVSVQPAGGTPFDLAHPRPPAVSWCQPSATGMSWRQI